MIALALIAATYAVGGTHVQQAYEPGITVRIYDIGQSMSNLMPLVAGQTPNIDVRVDSLDFAEGKFPSTAAFTSKDQFVLEASGEIFAKTDGTYRFRLTSDDGSSLRIDDKDLILNDGVHPAVAKTGEVTLKQGWHSFLVRYFESEGGERLLWEWAAPSGEFAIVSGDSVRVPKGITRVVAPGRKRLFRPGGDQRPGNGMPLDRLHPGFDLTTIRPAGFEPKVGAMAFLPDGRLLVSNFEPHNDGVFDPNARDGKIFMLTGVSGKDPSKITVKQVAENLKDPLGLAVVKNPARKKGYSVYVTEQFQVTELEDTNGDDVFDKATCVGNGWKSDNYHQFTFGLLEKDGWLYGSLSTAIDFNAPGLSGPNSANRGTVFRVDPKRYDPQNPSANIEFVTGGSRTPNGLIQGPGGELFVGENQGAWMPNNKYNHIEPGKFFGFYSPTAWKNAQYPNGGVAGPYDAQPMTPPTISIPQNEAGNSPAGGVTIAKGEFAGQMLTTDVKFGGLQRVWLDKVNGQLQGGIIPFTQGLESGTNRLVYGPDGSLYYGGIGATDSWAWVDPKTGKWTQFGLQRLRPNGKSTFEIHSMVATPTGFRLNLTRAVPKATLENPGSYFLQQWHYEPTEEYGGEKKGVETLKVTAAVASADRKSVLLTVPNLKEWRTVELRTSIKSDKGENLWAGQLWYTLNQIPGRDGRGLNLLVFSKTAGFRHDSIPSGQQMFRELGAGLDWKVTFSEDASIFTSPEFKKFQVVVFLNTTGDILNREQEVAFEDFIRKGGGWVGIHSAADCEYDWPFYGKLVGGYFLSHPAIQKVDIVITDRSHPATIFLPPVWTRTDELYDYKALPDPSIQILARLDTTTYQGHKMGPNHPFMWCHSFEGGRGFYTGMGHTKETYSEPKYREMIKQAVFWVAGQRS